LEKDTILQGRPVAYEMQVGVPKGGRRPQLCGARSRRTQQMRPLHRSEDATVVAKLNVARLCAYSP